VQIPSNWPEVLILTFQADLLCFGRPTRRSHSATEVAPLNQVPGAVVSLMDRTNVETVIVAGAVRKWKGQLLNVDLDGLRQKLEASRDYIFSAAKIPQNLFSSQ